MKKAKESTTGSEVLKESENTNQNKTTQIKVVTNINDNEDDLWEDFDNKMSAKTSVVTPTTTATMIIKQYLEMPNVDRKTNPLKFWKSHHSTFT